MNIIVITGQTGTGKTSYALELAKKHNGELINTDSRQVYKYLDIITGKDLPPLCHFEEQSDEKSQYSIGYYRLDGKRVWLYDVVDPKKYFSSYDFKVCAEKVIVDITSRGKTPIIIGGSYFYIKHLLYGFDIGQIPPNWNVREEHDGLSVEVLQQKLSRLNTSVLKTMNNSDQNNPRRLIRKIEIELYKKNNHNRINRLKIEEQNSLIVNQFIGLKCDDNSKLETRIKKRVEKRIKMGAFEEIESLLKRGYTKTDPGLQTIGYKQLIAFLEGSMTKQEAIEEWTLREVQYAKRQYTFMKKDKNISWIDV